MNITHIRLTSLHPYKNSQLIGFLSALAWLSFIFAAFKGFHFWYVGFVLFFWLSLAALNYRHKTSLWLLQNNFFLAARLYVVLFAIGFVGDFLVGQYVFHLWIYPYFHGFFDWGQLYLVVYPLGGLCIIELFFFLSTLFHERLIISQRTHDTSTQRIDMIDHGLVAIVILGIIGASLSRYFGFQPPFPHILLGAFLMWGAVATLQLIHRLQHALHWLAIILTTTALSIFLHEVPNTAVFEWRYQNAPILNYSMLGIPVWVFLGWYLMVIVVLRAWLRFVWRHK